VLITSGLSKAFGLPGLRIGWVAGPHKMIEAIWSHRDYTTIAPSILSDHLACIALEPARRERIFTHTRGILRTNLPPLEHWIASHGDLFDYTPPQAGAIVFLKYKLPIGSIELVDKLRTEQSVLIVAGDQCGLPKHIRIGFGSPVEYTQEGLGRIDKLLDSSATTRNRRPSLGQAFMTR